MADRLPLGFRVAGAHCGIKQSADNPDLMIVESERNCIAAGVYTQNNVVAAPVTLDRQRTPSVSVRSIVANSGNANACTGTQGDADAARMTEVAAAQIDVDAEQVLVLSTGIIGEHLPMSNIERGIISVAQQLGRDDQAIDLASRALMTTDTHPKVAERSLDLGGSTVRVFGMAKGAAMIGPRMATMLGIVLTDAPLPPDWVQSRLRAAVDDSFNCISVEGHMSTNDTVLLLANGAACERELTEDELHQVDEALQDVCIELAKAIPNDGEGATHLIEVEVREAATRDAAYQVAKTISESALVKTAVTGADPNWGRIVSAAGYSGVTFDPSEVRLRLNGVLLFEKGQPIPFDEPTVSASIRDNRTCSIQFDLGQGSASIRFWTCDMTAEYIRLNADYHT